MMPPLNLEADDQQALGIAIGCFLSDRIEKGRAILSGLPPEVLERLYTAGLRLGIEAHTLVRGTGEN